MRARLAVWLLAVTGTVSAQTSGKPSAQFNPSIQIHKVRDNVAHLTGSDRTTPCAPGVSGEVFIYCRNLSALFDPTTLQVAFASYVVSKQDENPLKAGVLSFLAAAAESRIDTQNGAPSSGSGTTSVAERSGISDVLGVALEAGAVTQTISGANLTLQGNALSLYRFVSQQEVFQYCPEGHANCRGALEPFLNKISGSATLGLSNASTQTATGTVTNSGSSATANSPSAAALIQNSASHLTGFDVRFQPINTLDLRSQAYLDAWKKAISDPSLIGLAEAANKTKAFAFFHPEPSADGTQSADGSWMARTSAAMVKLVDEQDKKADKRGNDEELISAITAAWDTEIPRWKDQGMSVDTLKLFLQAANAYMQARDSAIAKVRQTLASGLTFQYAYSRPQNQPHTSTARVIYTLHPGTLASDTQAPAAKSAAPAAQPAGSPKPKSTNDTAITFNFAADLYNSPPPGTTALRDLQAALQFDHHFGTTVATLAGYYQYQHSNSALTIGPGSLAPGTNITLNGNAATLLAPKGNIVVAQAMVTFALKAGTKMPVGVTWSNRTELIKGNELRGHVGFNFDWSSLLLGGQAKTANPAQP